MEIWKLEANRSASTVSAMRTQSQSERRPTPQVRSRWDSIQACLLQSVAITKSPKKQPEPQPTPTTAAKPGNLQPPGPTVIAPPYPTPPPQKPGLPSAPTAPTSP